MRILGITSNLFVNTTKSTESKPSRPVLSPMPFDCVSFSGHRHTPNSYELKELLAYDIPDIYSPVILIDSDIVEQMMREKVFDQPIKKIVRNLKKHEKSLFPVEKQFFELMKNAVNDTPQMKLDEFVHFLLPEHSKKLRNIQRPIFEKLDKLAKGMPKDLYNEYSVLREQTERKLADEPVYIPFSLKEFHYKLGRIKERIDKGSNYQAKLTIKALYELSGYSVPKSVRESRGFSQKWYEDKQANILLKISRIFEESVLKDDEDLKSLIKTSRAQMYKIPTNVKFNRKSFIYDLQEITDKLEDRKLARRMVRTAVKLPTSKENISAFVMKEEARSSSQIGYDLLSGSIGSADHILAQHKGGKDNISNYVLSSGYMNSQKAHERLAIFLRKNPEIRIYAQNHIDRLIELANAGVFKKIGLPKSYITDLANRLEKLSKSSLTSLILDTSALK